MKSFFRKLLSLPRGNKAKKTIEEELLDAYGGEKNILSLDACISRLRIRVRDISKTDHAKLRELGAAGVIVDGDSVQSVFGLRSEKLMEGMKKYTSLPDEKFRNEIISPITKANKKEIEYETLQNAKKIISVLGSKSNIVSVEECALTRVRVQIKERSKVKSDTINAKDSILFVELNENTYHILVGFEADKYAEAIKRQM